MRTRFLLVILMIALAAAVIPACAQEELIYSNFNSDPVISHPNQYAVLNIKADQDLSMALVQRVRTYHWNNGMGSEPGIITVFEDGEKIGSWQAIGRSAYGVQNVYWDALVDFTLRPDHSYYIAVSDPESMSYNAASEDCGMFELYGLKQGFSEHALSTGSGPASQPAVSAPIPSSVSIGQTFTMGRFEQDNNISNGDEPIEWQVLTIKDNRALVISKYILDVRAYQNAGNSWEVHQDRKWLNDEFYNRAFTDAEKSRILLVSNTNPDNQTYGTKGGNKTQDRIFYLSIDQTRYFSSDESRKAKPTAYAGAQGIYVWEDYGGTTYWSLRTPGYMESIRACVHADGITYPAGLTLSEGYENSVIGARPAFWLKLNTPVPTATPRACYKVTYFGDNCLSKVPTDSRCYQPGDQVTVLFEPVEYIYGLIFNGWDMGKDGVADFGYYYPTFTMPAKNVELHAICYQPQYDNQHLDVTIQERDPEPIYDQQQYDPTNNSWWYNYGYDYDGVG